MRVRYRFHVAGYVVMPEHVHLLLSEPETVVLGTALQALKLSVAVQSVQRPFWLARYHDFNVFSEGKRSEKIHYMHENPVNRGLVSDPGEWRWSSYRHYQTGDRGVVEIESEMTAARRLPKRSPDTSGWGTASIPSCEKSDSTQGPGEGSGATPPASMRRWSACSDPRSPLRTSDRPTRPGWICGSLQRQCSGGTPAAHSRTISGRAGSNWARTSMLRSPLRLSRWTCGLSGH